MIKNRIQNNDKLKGLKMRTLTKQSREESRLAQIKDLKEKHGANVYHVYNLIIAKYDGQFQEGPRPMVKIWRENAAKAYANYWFKNEQARKNYIDDQIAGAEAHISSVASSKRERKNDTSTNNRLNETLTIKKALAEYGITAKVAHGKGTAWGWLSIYIGAGQQFGEHETEGNHSHYYCPRCKKNQVINEFVLETVQRLTGRSGEYSGRINVHIQDHWNKKQGRSIPIEHDLEKLYKAIPGLKG